MKPACSRLTDDKIDRLSVLQIKDVAAQLGILSNYHFYWFCFFVLRYPLPPDWDVLVRNDTRYYVHLHSNTVQGRLRRGGLVIIQKKGGLNYLYNHFFIKKL